MRSRHLLTISAALFILSCLPLSSSLVQKQIKSTRQGSSPQSGHVTYLKDGHEIQADVPLDSHAPVIFLSRAESSVNRQPLIVTVRCPGREIIIYARRRTPSGQYHFDYALNENTADFSSLKDQNHLDGIASISVPPFDDPGETFVVIAVYFNDARSKAPKATTFTILASSRTTHLFAEAQYTGSVAKDQYVYFMVPIMRSDSTLLISLTNSDDEGETGLIASYGSKTRPTISDHQFASILQSKTRIIEINTANISPLDSMTGNLVIGVYGNATASSFTLATVYQDQKMIDLISGTSFAMAINQSSSANFKFLHESKTNLQVRMNKFSGELNLYMTCLNSTQNPASNLPDRSNHKWQISHADSQSFINIPIQDPQACFSCLYLINIEALSLTNFELLIDEGASFVPLQEGLSYPGELKPQESAPFELRTSNETEEAELRLATHGSELEILVSQDPTISLTDYLWKKVVPLGSKDHRISLKKTEAFKKDSFYILLYNPTNADMSYNFTIAIKSSKTFLMNGDQQQINIKPYQKISLLYYSNIMNHDKFTLAISSLTAQDLNNESIALKAVESALSQGQLIKIYFWTEEEDTPGPGQDVSFDILAPEVSFPNSRPQAFISQTILMKDSKGKYMIEVVNPWEFALTFFVKMKASRNDKLLLAENFHIADSRYHQIPQTYELFMTKAPAKWYYWLYACSDLTVQIGNKESELLVLSKGESYLHKESIQNKIESRFRNVTIRAHNSNFPPEFWMNSVLVDQSKFFDYELKTDDLKISHSYEYEEYDRSQVEVKFKPVEFQDPDPADKVNYLINICPTRYFPADRMSFCEEERYPCSSTKIELPVNHKEPITAKLGSVYDGENFVKIKATVVHQGQVVRFVPYPVGFVNVKFVEETTSEFWFKLFIAVVIGALVIWALWVISRKGRQGVDESRRQQEREASNDDYQNYKEE